MIFAMRKKFQVQKISSTYRCGNVQFDIVIRKLSSSDYYTNSLIWLHKKHLSSSCWLKLNKKSLGEHLHFMKSIMFPPPQFTSVFVKIHKISSLELILLLYLVTKLKIFKIMELNLNLGRKSKKRATWSHQLRDEFIFAFIS